MIKKKKAFSDGAVVKEAMMIIDKMVLEDEKYGTGVISALSNVQLGAAAMVRRESATWPSSWTGIWRGAGGSVSRVTSRLDSRGTAQLMVFIRMVFF